MASIPTKLVNVKIDVLMEKAAANFLALGSKQIRRDTAFAMQASGKSCVFYMRRLVPKYVDRPTPYTLNSVGSWPYRVNEQRLSQSIGWRDNRNLPEHYLEPMTEGKSRRMKRSEQRLGSYYIPTGQSPLTLNRYGNLPGGKLVQVLSRLRRFNTAGFNANRSNSRRSLLKQSRNDFFIKPSDNVIYARLKGRRIKPVLTMVKSPPSYKASFPVHDLLSDHYEQTFQRTMERYLTKSLAKRGGWVNAGKASFWSG